MFEVLSDMLKKLLTSRVLTCAVPFLPLLWGIISALTHAKLFLTSPLFSFLALVGWLIIGYWFGRKFGGILQPILRGNIVGLVFFCVHTITYIFLDINNIIYWIHNFTQCFFEPFWGVAAQIVIPAFFPAQASINIAVFTISTASFLIMLIVFTIGVLIARQPQGRSFCLGKTGGGKE